MSSSIPSINRIKVLPLHPTNPINQAHQGSISLLLHPNTNYAVRP
jgi:hypothetical protein